MSSFDVENPGADPGGDEDMPPDELLEGGNEPGASDIGDDDAETE